MPVSACHTGLRFMRRARRPSGLPGRHDRIEFHTDSRWRRHKRAWRPFAPRGFDSRTTHSAVWPGKRNGRRVVFTNGCFDLLHPGHIQLLEAARAMGDALVVGLNSDDSVRTLKGAGRPVIPEQERAEILANFECVDAVVVFDELTPQKTVAALLPDVLVKGGDWPGNQIVGREEVEAAGGKVVLIDVVEGYSTTEILRRIQSM